MSPNLTPTLRPDVRKLDVTVAGHLVGWLQDTHPLSFVYSAACLAGEVVSPFAEVIAVQPGELSSEPVQAYFENLLPEGDQRLALEQAHHVSSVFGMLALVGWDTAGALLLSPHEQAAAPDEYTPQTWAELAQIIAGQKTLEQATQSAISGAQYKLLICLDARGNPLLPKPSAASTYILKPDIVRTGQDVWASAINETILMRMAGLCQLTVAEVSYQSEVRSCLVKRYDRYEAAGVPGGKVLRISQSDFCQLLGLGSAVKYECDAGPTFADCYQLTKAQSSQPVQDCERLLKWLFFNLYTGNNDSHAKNLSILDTSSGPRLAPFYDLMCTTVYPGFKSEFAFKVGSTYVPGEMQREDLTLLGRSVGVSERYLLGLARSVAEQVLQAVAPAIEGLNDALGHGERVMAERIGFKVSRTCRQMATRLSGHEPRSLSAC